MKSLTTATVAGIVLLAGPASAMAATSSATHETTSEPTRTLQATSDDPATEATEATEAGDQTGAQEADQADQETGDVASTETLNGALGRAHAVAMKAWAQCVNQAARGPKVSGQPMPPKTACAPKPLGPGQIKQMATGEADDQSEDSSNPQNEPSSGTDEGADDADGHEHRTTGDHSDSHSDRHEHRSTDGHSDYGHEHRSTGDHDHGEDSD